MTEGGRIIILILNRDESSACSAAWRGPSILSHHHELVAGLKFTVEGKFCAYLTFKRTEQMEKHTERERERESKTNYCTISSVAEGTDGTS